MDKTCSACRQNFVVTDDDLAFYEKVSPVFNGKKELIPPPTLCPDCRTRRRLAHSNESKLYHRKCDLTGRQIISVHSPDKPFTVYEQKEWWGDKWDAKTYAQGLNLDEPFFPQFKRLADKVPVMSLVVDGNENADYANQTGWSKDCYLCFCVEYSEDCYYCHDTYHSKNAIDCYFGYGIERCYECIGCKTCMALFFSQNCIGCSDSWYLYDCQQCDKCFGCVGLRHKRHHWFNKDVSPEEFEKRLAAFRALDASVRPVALASFGQLLLKHPRRSFEGVQTENSAGNYLLNCRNAQDCFDSTDLHDCKYCTNVRNAKDCHDINRWGNPSELVYECMAVGERFSRSAFCGMSWNGDSDLYYCTYCMGSRDCFGCSGLRNARHCILNKQYTEEEYNTLVPKLIAKMRETGEWGEFYPATDSPFAYNETVAQEYYPLSKEEALRQGHAWHEEADAQSTYLGPAVILPEHIRDVSDEIIQKILLCEVTGKPYKIIPQELAFYRAADLPLPRRCPDQRHLDRMVLRNPRHLWDRTCAHCSKAIKTTYAPERPEIVWCEECYLSSIY